MTGFRFGRARLPGERPAGVFFLALERRAVFLVVAMWIGFPWFIARRAAGRIRLPAHLPALDPGSRGAESSTERHARSWEEAKSVQKERRWDRPISRGTGPDRASLFESCLPRAIESRWKSTWRPGSRTRSVAGRGIDHSPCWRPMPETTIRVATRYFSPLPLDATNSEARTPSTLFGRFWAKRLPWRGRNRRSIRAGEVIW